MSVCDGPTTCSKQIDVRTDGVGGTEFELESEDPILVQRILVKHSDVQQPLVEVACRNEVYARGEAAMNLLRIQQVSKLVVHNSHSALIFCMEQSNPHLLEFLAKTLCRKTQRHFGEDR